MKPFFTLCAERFAALEPELNALDAATGDGDHGATMLKGLHAILASDEAPEKAFRKAAGGASGSLFSQVIAALDKIEAGTAVNVALSDAAKRIEMLGQAKPGDKTMLDALTMAADKVTARAAAEAAEAGRLATKDMAAKRGRARHVEGAGVGHIDAGATSVATLLALYADWKDA